MRNFKHGIVSSLLVLVVSSAYAGSQRACESLLNNRSESDQTPSKEQKQDRAREVHIGGRELAEEVVEAIRANPHGFSHRDAEAAILRSLGDLSGLASQFLEKSNHWAHSQDLQVSLTQLNHALADFKSSVKKYEEIRSPGFKGKLLRVFDKQARIEKRARDVVDKIRVSRHIVQETRANLNQVMDAFESLKINFSSHLDRMQDSIASIQEAIRLVQNDPRLNEQERTNAHYALSKYLNSVSTSIAASETSLGMLQAQYTSTDMAVKNSEGQIAALVDAMAGRGAVIEGIFKPPFYVKSELVKNPNIRRQIIEIFYSGLSSEEILTQLMNQQSRSYNLEEILVIIKLLPKGTSQKIGWNSMLGAMDKNKYGEWRDSGMQRSMDIWLLHIVLNATGPQLSPKDFRIDRTEFARLKDYVTDIADSSQSFKKEGLQKKFEESIRNYLLDLADANLKAHFGAEDLEGP